MTRQGIAPQDHWKNTAGCEPDKASQSWSGSDLTPGTRCRCRVPFSPRLPSPLWSDTPACLSHPYTNKKHNNELHGSRSRSVTEGPQRAPLPHSCIQHDLYQSTIHGYDQISDISNLKGRMTLAHAFSSSMASLPVVSQHMTEGCVEESCSAHDSWERLGAVWRSGGASVQGIPPTARLL